MISPQLMQQRLCRLPQLLAGAAEFYLWLKTLRCWSWLSLESAIEARAVGANNVTREAPPDITERPPTLCCTESHVARCARPRAAGLLRYGHAAEAEDAHEEDAVDGGEAGGNVLPDHGEA